MLLNTLLLALRREAWAEGARGSAADISNLARGLAAAAGVRFTA